MSDVTWQSEDAEPLVDQSDVAGDNAVGNTYSVRFASQQARAARITVYGIVRDVWAEQGTEDDEEHDDDCRFRAETMIEFFVGGNPGPDDEEWCDYEYDRDVSAFDYATVEQAEQVARNAVASYITSVDDFISWDGTPQYGR